MAIRKIVQLGNPSLTQQAEEVTNIHLAETQQLVDDLLETVQNTGEHAAGLAANQIGELKQITVLVRMDLQNKPDWDGEPIWEVLINPKIVKQSEAESSYWEGCLSVNQGDLFGEVTRPRRVTVEYFDRDGNKKIMKNIDGYFSHLVQHEIDHLNGVMFTKYVTDPTELYTGEELDKMRG